MKEKSTTTSQVGISTKLPATEEPKSQSTQSMTGGKKSRSSRPKAFWLANQRYEVNTWRNMLLLLCKTLANETGKEFAQLVGGLKGTKRTYFSELSSDFRTPLLIPETSVYVEGNISGKQAEQIARMTLKKSKNQKNG